MKISIEPKAFAAELYKLLGVTNSKGPLNIVSNALITANNDGTVRLEATDLEVSVSTEISCDVTRPGKLCLSAHNLHSVIRGLKYDKADLSAQDNHYASLSCGEVDCKIVGVPPTEFPKLPILDELEFVDLPTPSLLEMIDRTIFSISTDEGRPNLMGALMAVQNGVMTQVSTDGHRLSRVHRPFVAAEVPDVFADGIIIPRKSLAELKRTLDKKVEVVRLAVTGTNAIFQFGTTTIMVRLVDAKFPDYNRVIPEELPERQARLNRAEFTQKLKFVALFSSPKTNNVTVTLDGDVLELTASDPETGEGKEVMPIDYSGPKVQVGFNCRYLYDILGVLQEPEFRFQILDAFSPTLLLDGDREEDLFLVMPMRL